MREREGVSTNGWFECEWSGWKVVRRYERSVEKKDGDHDEVEGRDFDAWGRKIKRHVHEVTVSRCSAAACHFSPVCLLLLLLLLLVPAF